MFWDTISNLFVLKDHEIKLYELMKRIRNGLELTNEDLTFIKSLPKEKLIEFIKINNDQIQVLRELL